MSTIQERLNQIIPKVEESSFLKNEGIGNEVGFYVFDYPPEDELKVREFVPVVVKHFEQSGKAKIVEVNLFDVLLETLKSRGKLDAVLKAEKKGSSEKLKKQVAPLVRKEVVAQKVVEAVGDADVVFLTGVGSAFPLIRTHEVLNNLHDRLPNTPVVSFYPGVYNLQELVLFGLLDANYYRAFRLVS